MKIARIECLSVHSVCRKNFVFVRVEADAGVVGWGEAYSQWLSMSKRPPAEAIDKLHQADGGQPWSELDRTI